MWLFIRTWSSYHKMSVKKTVRYYSLVGRQLCTNWQKLTVAEVRGPVNSKPTEKRRTPQSWSCPLHSVYHIAAVTSNRGFCGTDISIINQIYLVNLEWINSKNLAPFFQNHFLAVSVKMYSKVSNSHKFWEKKLKESINMLNNVH